jgi:hypothetical protein
MNRIKGPAAADDSGRLLRVVARSRDELKAVDDGCQRESLPQCRFVFVEVSQNRREKIRVVEIRHMTSVAATWRSGESWPWCDNEDGMIPAGIHGSLELNMYVAQGPLWCNHQFPYDVEAVISLHTFADDGPCCHPPSTP